MENFMTNPLFDGLLGRHAGSRRPFLYLADGHVVTYGEFLATTSRFAGALTELGLVPGDRLAMQVSKSPEALALYAACVQAGVVFLPLNTAYTPSEVDYFVGDAGAKVLAGDPSAAGALTPIADAHGARFVTLDGSGRGTLRDIVETRAPEFTTVERSPDDLVAFLYTSGTTGRSKGAMLTQDNLLSNARVLADYWRFTADDVLLHALPIFHTHGLFVATNITCLIGSSMIFLPKFDAAEALARIGQATVMMGVPTYYTRLLAEPGLTREAVSHMRLFVSGSAPLLAETHVEFERRTGQRILERYGMTETGMNSSNPYDGERRAGTVGFALPGVEIRVVDPESGAELPAGDVGMIEVRGPNVFKGYWRMPEKTREELHEDGFFVTGDLGFFDEDGYLHIVGRGKDLIISGGFNVYPKEVEQFLNEQEGVAESAVIGVPHPDFGEGVVGILVAEKGATVDTDVIAAELADKLANYKRPKKLLVIDELPRNTMGKVQKNVLRERYGELFGARA